MLGFYAEFQQCFEASVKMPWARMSRHACVLGHTFIASKSTRPSLVLVNAFFGPYTRPLPNSGEAQSP